MKKLILVFVATSTLTACSSGSKEETTTEITTENIETNMQITEITNEKNTITIGDSNNTLKNTDDFPEFVTELYQAYESTIKSNNMNLKLRNIEKEQKEESVFYTFYIHYPIRVSIHYYNNEFSSYSLVFSNNDVSNTELKDIITLAISATEGIDFNTAKESMQTLVNSFNGVNNSEPIKLEKYKYIIIRKAIGTSLAYNSLEITPLNTKDDFNKSDYPKVNAEYMQGSINEGEHASITGTVTTDSGDKLEIENEEGKFIIHYNSAKFAGDFEIGKNYTFYGDIASLTLYSGYSGCLRVDYFEEKK